MSRRILRAIFYTCMLACLAGIAGTVWIIYQNYVEDQQEILKSQAQTAASLLDNHEAMDPEFLKASGLRISLIKPDGTVYYDSMFDPENMSNHADRKEIIEAKENGEGFVRRRSDSLSEETYYAAIRLNSGSIVRLAKTNSSLFSFLAKALWPIVLIMLAALLISWLLAERAARKIVAPINAIDPSNPLQDCPYEQLRPLLNRLEDNRKRINEQMEDLDQKNREFKILTRQMDEGLIMASENGRIVFLNEAARRLFGFQKEGNLFESHTLHELSEKVMKEQYARTIYHRDHKTFLVQASRIDPVHNPDGQGGLLILVLDITEKEEAAKRRAEFTANVTHELKTPLQTILSSSELLENGMVTDVDVPVFAGYIHTEALRMTQMINDIIHLSRLDTHISENREDVRLDQLIHVVISDLQPMASLDQISLTEHLEKATVHASRADLDDIVRHLLENAINYNTTGGSVEVLLGCEKDHAVLKIKDTGRGIPKALQDRIFERFFTWGKPKNGKGTGLGLAIVQHAVTNLQGSVEVSSVYKQGTEFTVRLPLAENKAG